MAGKAQGPGQNTYAQCLRDAQDKGVVGIHKHMVSPTAPTSRLGFKGKPASKKTLRELAESAIERAGRSGGKDNVEVAIRALKALQARTK